MNKISAWALAAMLVAAGHSRDALARAHQFEKPGPCDRACLIKLAADDYLAALVAPERFPALEEQR